jgi:hypothetical protein
MRRRRIHAPAFLMTFAAAGAVASAGCGKVASDPEPVVGGCNPPAPPVDAAASCPAEQPAANGMCPSGLVCTYAVDGGTCNGAPVSDSVTVTCGPMGWYESAGSSSSCNPPAQFPDAGEDAEADGGP